MPKPIYGINGSGMHVHQSLFDAKTGKNVFYDANDKYKLSKTAYGYIAGQLAHVREMSAVLSLTVNSYKRLVPGYEAPVYICWGQRNRSALIRVPRFSPLRGRSQQGLNRDARIQVQPVSGIRSRCCAQDSTASNASSRPLKVVEEDVYHFDSAKLASRNIATLLKEALEEINS